MSLCVNPGCRNPHNLDRAEICSSCGSQLLLRMRYRPIRILGKGTFGQTLLAIDEDIPSRPYCAVKQFHFSSPHPDVLDKAIELFRQEAHRLETLGIHPQIPALLACFQQGQQLYLVQEFIEGLTLEEELQQQGTYTEAQVWQLLRDLLPVLKFIYQNQVIHRDIKPQNIIRRKQDNKPILIDFGCAKRFISETNLIQPGTQIGTWGYAPPEQMINGKVNQTSDLYSLGVTCVRMLTGTPTAIEMYDTENEICQWQEYLPSKASISSELSQILNKLLQKTIKDRYQSADEVLGAILPFFEDTRPPINLAPNREGFVYWLMGERAGRITVNVWNWLWGISEPPRV
ncbi:serine/threonine protein kinase [Fischerella thermalis CCMEE 5268]|uniref:non-specific serine/threonine protein kinase n=1 Tax=Fischerella thermalis CCMEE 5268 TaxID=2019662 RepID=A0A2N6KKT3_9CYAN|nr:serine/threonine-protein kinase [Fischerella thermalis]PMB00375.1 serine/threonine protein kinase [Fischerella thermalis CCMEE 5268]